MFGLTHIVIVRESDYSCDMTEAQVHVYRSYSWMHVLGLSSCRAARFLLSLGASVHARDERGLPARNPPLMAYCAGTLITLEGVVALFGNDHSSSLFATHAHRRAHRHTCNDVHMTKNIHMVTWCHKCICGVWMLPCHTRFCKRSSDAI